VHYLNHVHTYVRADLLHVLLLLPWQAVMNHLVNTLPAAPEKQQQRKQGGSAGQQKRKKKKQGSGGGGVADMQD
jgi:hypothetical protein